MARGLAQRHDDKRLVFEYSIERLNSDGDALKQECHLAHIAGSGTQPPIHLSEKIQRAWSYPPRPPPPPHHHYSFLTVTPCSRVFQPVIFNVCSQCSTLLYDSFPIHQVAVMSHPC